MGRYTTLLGKLVGPFNRFGFLQPGLILLLAFALRLHRLENRDVSWDEGWSVWLARQDLSSIALRTANDEHPPLHYWLLHFWDIFAGEDEFVLRFSTVLVSVLTVALVYAFGRRFFGREIATLAAALLAVNRFHISWSQEVKMYALLVFLALLSLYLCLKAVKESSLRNWLFYTLATSAALYTHYLSILLLPVEWAVVGWALWRGLGDRRVALRWVGVQCLVFLAYLPWMRLYFERSMVFERIEALDLASAFRLYVTLLPLGASTNTSVYNLLALGYSVLAVAGGIAILRRPLSSRLAGLAVVLSLLVVPVALALFTLPAQSIYHPKVSDRYFILFLPMYTTVGAAGLRLIYWKSRPAGMAAVLVVMAVSIHMLGLYYSARRVDSHTDALAYFVQSYVDETDTVVLNTDLNWPLYHYYLAPLVGRWVHIPYMGHIDSEEDTSRMLALKPAEERLWLITTPGATAVDPHGTIVKRLDRDYRQLVSKSFGRTRVTLYARPDWEEGLALKQLPGGLKGERSAAEDLRFLGFNPVPKDWRRGDTIYVFARWEVPASPIRGYSVDASLTEGRLGQPVRTVEVPLVLEYSQQSEDGPLQVQTLHKIDLGPSMLEGDYQLRLTVKSAEGAEQIEVPLQTVSMKAALNTDSEEKRISSFEVELDGVVKLLGYGLDPSPLRVGGEAKLHLIWESLGSTDTSYTVFVHIFDEEETVRVNGDSVPGDGQYPVSGWVRGDRVEDTHTLRIPKDTPPGKYRLAVGMYDATTGERLRATDPDGKRFEDDRIVLTEVEVGG